MSEQLMKVIEKKTYIWFYNPDHGGHIYLQYKDKTKMTTPYKVTMKLEDGSIVTENVWHSNPDSFFKDTGIKVKTPSTIKVFDKEDIFQKKPLYVENVDDDYSLAKCCKLVDSASFNLKDDQQIYICTNTGASGRTVEYARGDKE